MDPFEKLKQVSQQAWFEDPEEGIRRVGVLPCGELPVFNAVVSGGCRMRLLKSLLTTVCENNCGYCGIRWGKDSRRVTFQPEEMADVFLRLYEGGACQGLFLSSGIAGGGVRTQDKLIATAGILRRRGYRGYLHLKIMPGAEHGQVEQAMRHASRVSINLEAPTAESLAAIAPRKCAGDLYQPLRWIDAVRRSQDPVCAWNGRWPSSSTQFVVGAGGESDRNLLHMAERLRKEVGLARIHYSTFEPAEGTPLENAPPENPARSFRLYQADFLIRDYGFSAEELLPYGDRLPLDVDPKLLYARQRLAEAPVEINRADRRDLLRVPGIGPRPAKNLLDARRNGILIRHVEDLKRLGVSVDRAAAFILLNGRRPVQQIKMF
jgi:predicted DNA-binding helix-hairpin-helix protein